MITLILITVLIIAINYWFIMGPILVAMYFLSKVKTNNTGISSEWLEQEFWESETFYGQ
jgi:hypothetical protein